MEGSRGRGGVSRLERLYLSLAVASLVVVSAAYVLFPRARRSLYAEGYLVEALSAWMFLGAALAGLVTARRAGLPWGHPRMLIPALALVSYLEEVSWGLSDLGIPEPRVLWLKVDGLHDLLTLAFAVYIQHGSLVSRVTVGMGAGVALAAMVATRRRLLYPLGRTVLGTPCWRFTAVGVGLVAVALALDTDQIGGRYVKAMEETLELDAALALLFAALTIGRGLPGPGSFRGAGTR